jgi:sugar phosphate isomerase/epimerase
MEVADGDGTASQAPTSEIPAVLSPPAAQRLATRIGLSVPNDWWASASLLKSFEAAGFGYVQLHSPPASVLADARLFRRYAAAQRKALESVSAGVVVHGPSSLVAGVPEGDRALEGLLAYAAEIGAEQVIYHARAFPDEPGSQDRLLSETRSLARLAARAERLGVTIAIENLCPVYPGPELLCHTPMTLRTLVNRIASPSLGLCLDVGHAHVAAELKHTTIDHLMAGVLDAVVLFHVHDNLGARRHRTTPPGLDPLRLDLHLAPGRGRIDWAELSWRLAAHHAPMVLEVHPPNRPAVDELRRTATELLTREASAREPSRTA